TQGGVTIIAGTTITQDTDNTITAHRLETVSGDHQLLIGLNRVDVLKALSRGGGNIHFVNGTDTLIVSEVTQQTIGNIIVDQAGNVLIGRVHTERGDVTLNTGGWLQSAWLDD